MILKRLAELGQKIPATPPGYSLTKVAWSIDLDDRGRCLGLRRLTEEGSTAGVPAMVVPCIRRSADISAKLIVDNATYVLGMTTERHGSEAAGRRHKAYVDLIEDAYNETGSGNLTAIMAFLRSRSRPEIPDEFKPTQNVTFTVNGLDPTQDRQIVEYWGRRTGEKIEPDGEDTVMGQCMVCGETKPVLQRLEYKIKGLPGGQPSGTQIICADKDSFESYGRKNSLNSPTCRECGERFTKAVNYLLATPAAHRLIRSGSKVAGALLYWSCYGRDDSLNTFLGTPAEEEAGAHYDDRLLGKRPECMDDYPIYILYLKANGGRAVIRMWEETTKREVDRKTGLWLRRQAVTGPWGGIAEPLAISRYYDGRRYRSGLLDDLLPAKKVKGKQKQRIYERGDGHLAEAVISSMLHGRPLPRSLLSRAVMRCMTEGGVTTAQASMIKMALCRSEREDELMVGLDKNNADPGYLCGRAMSIIESIQRASIRQSRAGYTGDTAPEKLFGAASVSPLRVFPRLLHLVNQAYLPKVRRSNYGAYVLLSRELSEIHGMIGENYPRTLSYEQRGRYMIGYYHQKAASAADRRERYRRSLKKRNNGADGDHVGNIQN